jgi:hypothetical protein
VTFSRRTRDNPAKVSCQPGEGAVKRRDRTRIVDRPSLIFGHLPKGSANVLRRSIELAHSIRSSTLLDTPTHKRALERLTTEMLDETADDQLIAL